MWSFQVYFCSVYHNLNMWSLIIIFFLFPTLRTYIICRLDHNFLLRVPLAYICGVYHIFLLLTLLTYSLSISINSKPLSMCSNCKRPSSRGSARQIKAFHYTYLFAHWNLIPNLHQYRLLMFFLRVVI